MVEGQETPRVSGVILVTSDLVSSSNPASWSHPPRLLGMEKSYSLMASSPSHGCTDFCSAEGELTPGHSLSEQAADVQQEDK